MNSIMATPPLCHIDCTLEFPHLDQVHVTVITCIPPGVVDADVFSPVSFAINSAPSRKRKAEDDDPQPEDRMSASPTTSPALAARSLPAHRQTKRSRTGLSGRPLALPRLLETLDADSLRNVLQSICSRHPGIGTEVENTAPKPNVSSTINVLKEYESVLQSSFPFGGEITSDYAYNRVRPALLNLIDALADFTPHFLPLTSPKLHKLLLSSTAPPISSIACQIGARFRTPFINRTPTRRSRERGRWRSEKPPNGREACNCSMEDGIRKS